MAHYRLSVYSVTFDPFKRVSPAVIHGMAVCRAYQEVMRYWAKLMLTGVPVMVTWRSLVPSSWLPILIWAPDTCLISLILVPWRPMIEPISCGGAGARRVSRCDWKPKWPRMCVDEDGHFARGGVIVFCLNSEFFSPAGCQWQCFWSGAPKQKHQNH